MTSKGCLVIQKSHSTRRKNPIEHLHAPCFADVRSLAWFLSYSCPEPRCNGAPRSLRAVPFLRYWRGRDRSSYGQRCAQATAATLRSKRVSFRVSHQPPFRVVYPRNHLRAWRWCGPARCDKEVPRAHGYDVRFRGGIADPCAKIFSR